MADIRVGEVFRRLEENTPVAECFADVDNTCPLTSACRLRVALVDAVEAFYAHLDDVTLDALVCDNEALFTIFSAPPCMKRA
jgi:Rrf2 family nitric oxide-sensitive transcriptional repressor